MSEDRTTIPLANHVMAKIAILVIACQAVYVITLVVCHFASVPVPISPTSVGEQKWPTVRYTASGKIWLAQVFLSVFSIYQASFCILASSTIDPYLCNVYWQNCMIGVCFELYCLYSFLLLKDQAVDYGRTRCVQFLHKGLLYGIVGLIPTGFVISFVGLKGKIEPITNRNGTIVSNEPACVLEFSSWALILVPSLDAIVTGICLYLFVQPMLLLKNQAEVQGQISEEQKFRAKDYERIIRENLVAGVIGVLFTSWIFIAIFISKAGFHSNLAHVDCVLAVSSGLINSFLGAYTTRRGWKIERQKTVSLAAVTLKAQESSIPSTI